MSVINLAHGPVIALGMFGAYLLFTHLGVNPYLAMVPVAGAGLIAGLVIYVISVHRVINAPHLSSLLSTFAVNMIIIGVGTAVFTTSPQNIDYSLGSVEVGFLTFPASRLVGAFGAILVTACLYLFLYFTWPGKAIRAVANNRMASELMGIPSSQVLALSFGLGTMMAAPPACLSTFPRMKSTAAPARPGSSAKTTRCAAPIWEFSSKFKVQS